MRSFEQVALQLSVFVCCCGVFLVQVLSVVRKDGKIEDRWDLRVQTVQVRGFRRLVNHEMSCVGVS